MTHLTDRGVMTSRVCVLLFIAGFQLDMYAVKAETPQDNTGAVFVSQQTAHTVLHRQRRYNTGRLEEVLQKDNLERECKEETCNFEETREVFENVEQTMEFWAIYSDGDQCESAPCQNGGVCQDGISAYQCYCKSTFRGKNCEIQARMCTVDNGGCMHFCVTQERQTVCLCAAGYKLGADETSCEPTEPFSCGVVSLSQDSPTKSVLTQSTSNNTITPRSAQNSNSTQPDDYYEEDTAALYDYLDFLMNGSDTADFSHHLTARSVNSDLALPAEKEFVKADESGSKSLSERKETSQVFPTWPPVKVKVNLEERIVGGDVTLPGEIPWQVSLMVSVPGPNRAKPFCGGSLLSELWVITAAHCLDSVGTDFFVRVGEHDLNVDEGPERDHAVAERHVHSSYKKEISEYNHDLALLKLTSPVELSDHRRPICLGPKFFTQNLLRGASSSLVSGWGKLRFRGPEAAKLQKVALPYVDRTVCKASSQEYITRFMFCAGYPDQQKDSCKGDSGGPHATNYKGTWFLTGIVSWGEECAKEGKYGIYTRVSHYYPWISRTTGIKMTN